MIKTVKIYPTYEEFQKSYFKDFNRSLDSLDMEKAYNAGFIAGCCHRSEQEVEKDVNNENTISDS